MTQLFRTDFNQTFHQLITQHHAPRIRVHGLTQWADHLRSSNGFELA
jgi:hypothetical protein